MGFLKSTILGHQRQSKLKVAYIIRQPIIRHAPMRLTIFHTRQLRHPVIGTCWTLNEEFRRPIVGSDPCADIDFAVLAFSDNFYLWKQAWQIVLGNRNCRKCIINQLVRDLSSSVVEVGKTRETSASPGMQMSLQMPKVRCAFRMEGRRSFSRLINSGRTTLSE